MTAGVLLNILTTFHTDS